MYFLGVLPGLVIRNRPANAENVRGRRLIPGWEDPLEKGMASHSSLLAWRIPWTEEPGGPQSIELHRVRYNWSDLACTHAVCFYQREDTAKSLAKVLVLPRNRTGAAITGQSAFLWCFRCMFANSVLGGRACLFTAASGLHGKSQLRADVSCGAPANRWCEHWPLSISQSRGVIT